MNIDKSINTVNFFKDSEWSLKSKWYHIVFWASYFIFWVIVSSSSPLIENIAFNVLFLAFNIFPVYSILYYFMPKYLYNQRYIVFGMLTLFLVLISAALLIASLFIVHSAMDLPADKFFTWPSILGPTLGSVSTSVILFMMAKLIKNSILTEQKNKTLEHEKTENELKFLKSQLNPHFLFNAMNNIYFLIKKDPDTAAESLAKFSDMVRYQLYECNEDKILLSQEIDYINNYVEITSLGKAETTDIKVEIGEYASGLKISPLMLIPLVENAFKHVNENENGKNYVEIDINFSDDILVCNTRNSIDRSKPSIKIMTDKKEQKEGGLGLANLKRRLSLLYPKNHIIELIESKLEYSSKLELRL